MVSDYLYFFENNIPNILDLWYFGGHSRCRRNHRLEIWYYDITIKSDSWYLLVIADIAGFELMILKQNRRDQNVFYAMH